MWPKGFWPSGWWPSRFWPGGSAAATSTPVRRQSFASWRESDRLDSFAVERFTSFAATGHAFTSWSDQ